VTDMVPRACVRGVQVSPDLFICRSIPKFSVTWQKERRRAKMIRHRLH